MADPADHPNPFLIFCPYLPVDEPVSFGDWELAPVTNFDGRWLSSEFEHLSKQFLAAFKDANGQELRNPALNGHRSGGMDGRLPPERQRVAMQRALDFAALDQNPRPDQDNAGWFTSTSDNSEVFIWPIDTKEGRIAFQRGAMVSILAGGRRITPNLIVSAPYDLHVPWRVNLDEDLTQAVYDVCMVSADDQDAVLARRIEVAIGWLAKAWRNTPSIRPEDRLVLLKTGFEALSGEGNSWKCALWVRQLYQDQLAGTVADDVGHLLWSPAETERHVHRYQDAEFSITDLQHWFLAFSAIRNEVIHGGLVPELDYRKAGSRYVGSFVFVGERFLRESIKVSLGRRGKSGLWRDLPSRRVLRRLQVMEAKEE